METNEPKSFNQPNQCTESAEAVMKDLEQKVNPKSLQESLVQLNKTIETGDPSSLLASMNSGAKEFEARVGRSMTYSEMRSMWG